MFFLTEVRCSNEFIRGETDGGSNSNVNPVDGNLGITGSIYGTFRDGMVSYNIDNLDLNHRTITGGWLVIRLIRGLERCLREVCSHGGPLMKVLIHFRWTG